MVYEQVREISQIARALVNINKSLDHLNQTMIDINTNLLQIVKTYDEDFGYADYDAKEQVLLKEEHDEFTSNSSTGDKEFGESAQQSEIPSEGQSATSHVDQRYRVGCCGRGRRLLSDIEDVR